MKGDPHAELGLSAAAFMMIVLIVRNRLHIPGYSYVIPKDRGFMADLHMSLQFTVKIALAGRESDRSHLAGLLGAHGWLSKLWSLFGYPRISRIIIGIQKGTIILTATYMLASITGYAPNHRICWTDIIFQQYIAALPKLELPMS